MRFELDEKVEKGTEKLTNHVFSKEITCKYGAENVAKVAEAMQNISIDCRQLTKADTMKVWEHWVKIYLSAKSIIKLIDEALQE